MTSNMGSTFFGGKHFVTHFLKNSSDSFVAPIWPEDFDIWRVGFELLPLIGSIFYPNLFAKKNQNEKHLLKL